MIYLKKEMPEKITAIPAYLKSQAERKSGCDLSNVKVHYNSTKPADYQAVGIAQKNTIHLAPFHENKIKHEVVHIVQQKQNTFPVCQQRGSVVSDWSRKQINSLSTILPILYKRMWSSGL